MVKRFRGDHAELKRRQMTTWSHSRLEAYEDCPRKYKYRYIDKIESERQSIYLLLGKAVHKAFENLYKALHYGTILTVDALFQEFEQAWEAERTANVDIPVGRTEDEFKELGRRCIQNYYKRHYPFKDGTTLGIEDAAVLEIEDGEEKIKFIGYIDRLSRREDGTIEIHDYKTGKVQSQIKLDQDRQLALYQIAIQQRWPDVNSVVLVWHYVAYDIQLQSRRTPEQLEEAKRHVISLVRQIQSDTTFEPHKSALCSYCDYQARCPLWRHLFEVQGKPELPIVQLVDEYGELKHQKKEIEAKIESLEEQFASQLQDERQQRFFGTRWAVTLTRTQGVAVPSKEDPKRKALEKILRDAGMWDEVTSLDTAAFKKLISHNGLSDDLLTQIEPLIENTTGLRYNAGKVDDETKAE